MLRRGFLKRIGAGCAGLWLGMGIAKWAPVQDEWIDMEGHKKVIVVWTGEGSPGDFASPSNYNRSVAPVAGDTVVFPLASRQAPSRVPSWHKESTSCDHSSTG